MFSLSPHNLTLLLPFVNRLHFLLDHTLNEGSISFFGVLIYTHCSSIFLSILELVGVCVPSQASLLRAQFSLFCKLSASSG